MHVFENVGHLCFRLLKCSPTKSDNWLDVNNVLFMEYSTMVELPLLVPEIWVKVQVRTNILSNQIDNISCVVLIIHDCSSKFCDPAIGGSLVGGDK